MNPAVKHRLRQVVARTRGLRSFGYFYRGLYWVGIRAFVAALGRLRGVRSIYLRGSLCGGDWVPGDSDVDLSVVIADLDPQSEVAFLKEFWRRQRLLESVFPFLSGDDIALLTHEELSQTDLAPQRFAPFAEALIPRWRLLWGEELRVQRYAAADRWTVLRHLRHFYRALFGMSLAEPDLERASSRPYERLALKISELVRFLGNLEPEAVAPRERIARRLYGVMRLVDDLHREIPEDAPAPRRLACPEGASAGIDEVDGARLRRFFEGWGGAARWVRCVLAIPDSLYVIVDPACSSGGFEGLLARLRESFPSLARQGFAVNVMLEEAFKGELRFPHSYGYGTSLLRYGRVVYGQDIRMGLREPSDDHVLEGLRHLSAVVAPVNVRRLLRACDGAALPCDPGAVYALVSYRLALEKGVFAATIPQTCVQYQRSYAEEAPTRLLIEFRERLRERAVDPRTMENLYLFARHLLKAVRIRP